VHTTDFHCAGYFGKEEAVILAWLEDNGHPEGMESCKLSWMDRNNLDSKHVPPIFFFFDGEIGFLLLFFEQQRILERIHSIHQQMSLQKDNFE
jgi:hypothetical protein